MIQSLGVMITSWKLVGQTSPTVMNPWTNCEENSEVTPGVSPNEKDTAMVSERKDENANSTPLEHPEINDDSPVKDVMKSEEDNGNVDGASERGFPSKEKLDAPEKLEKNNEIPVNEVFDPGCTCGV